MIPLKWIIYEDFKNLICSLAEQNCTVKTSEMSQMNPKYITLQILHSKFNYNNIAGYFL